MKFLTSYFPTGRKVNDESTHAARHPASISGFRPGRRFPGTSGIFCGGISGFWLRAVLVVPQAPGRKFKPIYHGNTKNQPLLFKSILAGMVAGEYRGAVP